MLKRIKQAAGRLLAPASCSWLARPPEKRVSESAAAAGLCLAGLLEGWSWLCALCLLCTISVCRWGGLRQGARTDLLQGLCMVGFGAHLSGGGITAGRYSELEGRHNPNTCKTASWF
jgi:hypothetical protein